MDKSEENETKSQRLVTIDLLRAVACTLVSFYHLSAESHDNWLKIPLSFGWVGVQIFFVISGFVIPYAAAQSQLVFPRDRLRFIFKRLIRLDPPYWVASAGAALVAYLAWKTPGFTGSAPPISWGVSLAHIGYLNGVLGLPWYNHVCWTLGIEFQFYLVMAMCYPLLMSENKLIRIGTLGGALTLGTFAVGTGFVVNADNTGPWIVSWCPYFVMGIVCCHRFRGMSDTKEFVSLWMMSSLVAFLTSEPGGAIAAILACIAIVFVKLPSNRWVSAYAMLTYSLYLVCVPVGVRAVHVTQRLGSGAAIELLAFTAGVISSLIAAHFLWRFVEMPSLSLANRVCGSPRKALREKTKDKRAVLDLGNIRQPSM